MVNHTYDEQVVMIIRAHCSYNPFGGEFLYPRTKFYHFAFIRQVLEDGCAERKENEVEMVDFIFLDPHANLGDNLASEVSQQLRQMCV